MFSNQQGNKQPCFSTVLIGFVETNDLQCYQSTSVLSTQNLLVPVHLPRAGPPISKASC